MYIFLIIYIVIIWKIIKTILWILGLILIYAFCSIKKKAEKSNCNITNNFEKYRPLYKKQYKNTVGHVINGMIKYYMDKISKMPCHWLRMFFYKYVFNIDIADNVVIYKGCIFRAPYKIHIGANTVIGDDCILDGRGGLYIGENVNLSSEVRIWTAQHSVNSPEFSGVSEPVYIYDRAWVSSNTIILPGSIIETGAVVTAGGVVTKCVHQFTYWGGVPAKFIGNRSRELTYSFTGEHDWFF